MGTTVWTLSSLYEAQNEIHIHRCLVSLSSVNLEECKLSLLLQSWELKHEPAAVLDDYV